MAEHGDRTSASAFYLEGPLALSNLTSEEDKALPHYQNNISHTRQQKAQPLSLISRSAGKLLSLHSLIFSDLRNPQISEDRFRNR